MTSRPILFTPDNAQKIAEGRKVQTRRIMKPQPVLNQHGYFKWTTRSDGHNGLYTHDSLGSACPYGTVGDQLMVAQYGLMLEIEAVRVERVQGISEEDVRAEGVSGMAAFIELWDSIHGPGAWERNEWVWVLRFVKVEP